MSETVNVQEAKTRLSELLRRVEAGEEIVIARAGLPIARIQATTAPQRNLDQPLLPEIPPMSADSLFEDLTDDDLNAWEGADSADPMFETAS